ncbi:1-acyl-sn-glycerol-3-phosphate acyltransferase [Verrucomicrobiaceae bacterium N1E253]|uniref:1-acyl-sn-glycerol-3-phosphate acyltransferase n=1 Tax=Oceaniferula marina TaxID=2748318 RepID=A0A851GNE8_9BACT|nr:1-acyl-sn-glycerol-3-phosphate acyltransferase [Oceaniferula marina]NWK56360.1 1-acyl-sn-glycerol-3-phosphate acyltransferase [Oceaniferula marina]
MRSVSVTGGERLRALAQDPNVRLVMVANHSTHSDVEVLAESQRLCGVWGAYMAAHEVFARSRFQAWVMQRTGAFSVNRENVDRQSIQEAVRVIEGGRCCLTLFPEGNVAFSNEKVMPFLDGASFIAVKAQKKLGRSVRVLVVPTSIRMTHTRDVRMLLQQQIQDLLDVLAGEGVQVHWREDDPFYVQIEMLGYAILRRGLQRRGYDFSCGVDAWRTDPAGAMEKVVAHLLDQLESSLEIQAAGGALERARMVRSQLAKKRLGGEGSQVERLDDLSILLMRVLSYDASYLRECPSVDRCSETLEKLREDYAEVLVRPVSARHAEVRFGEPVEVSGKSIKALTDELEMAVGEGLGYYQSSYPGGEMMASDCFEA